MKITILNLLLIPCLTFSISAHALDQCPVEFGNDDYLGKVGELATNATSCYEATEIVSACALGASGDVYTVSAANDRCSSARATRPSAVGGHPARKVGRLSSRLRSP